MTLHSKTLLAAALALLAFAPVRAQEEEAPRQNRPKKSAAAKKPKTPAKPAAKPYSQRVDLNSATREQLLKVKGMTPAMADRILKDRPYKTNAELVKRSGLQRTEFDAIHPSIVVIPPGKPALKPAPKAAPKK